MATSPYQPHSRGAVVAFRVVAYIEAATYLVLMTLTVWHRAFDGPDLVRVPGMVHGIAFLVYVALVLVIREGQGWGFWRTVLVLFLSAVPFGGFWAGSHLSDEPASTRAA